MILHTQRTRARRLGIPGFASGDRWASLLAGRLDDGYHYLRNVATLQKILRNAGIQVRIGTLIADITHPTEVEIEGGIRLKLEPLERRGNRLAVNGFDPCVVLLNNEGPVGAARDLLVEAVLPG